METKTTESGRGALGYAMKIYFCDICNESIPLKDINSNRITIEEGKIFCQKCAPKKQKAIDGISGGMAALSALMLVALVVIGVYGWKVTSDLDLRQRSLKTTVESAGEKLGTVEALLVVTSKTLKEELGPRLDRFEENLKTARVELQQRFDSLDRRESDNNSAQRKTLQDSFDNLDRKHDKAVDALKGIVQQLQIDSAGQKVSVDAIRDQLQLIREMMTAREPAVPSKTDVAKAAEGPAPAGGTEKTEMESREVNTLIAMLADTDPGKRYSAVVELGRYAGIKVVKAIEGAVVDTESYIRQAAVQTLSKLGAVASVGVIVGALRDKDYFVRGAAIKSLRSLSGTEIAFDPDGSPSEREGKVKEWEHWWAANKERLSK